MITGSIEQQLWAFREQTESTFEKSAKENDEGIEKLRRELNTGLQSIRDDVQYRFERIERLLLEVTQGDVTSKQSV